jgi:RimJ/RimL family protein N-acetyltransferase
MTVEPRRAVYRVETDRIVVRCWSPDDAKRLRAALDDSNDHLRPWIPWMKHEPRPLEATTQWLRETRAKFDRDEDYRYAIFDPREETLIGEVALLTRAGAGAREIGYWINVASAGRGYATEAAGAMVKVGFEIDRVTRIEIHCAVPNAASAAVPLKLGFRHETTLPRRLVASDDTVHDVAIFTMFGNEYPGSRASTLRISAFDCAGERLG